MAARLGLWGLQMALLPTQKVWDGPGTSLHWLAMFGAGACPFNILSLTLFLACFAAAGGRPAAPRMLSGNKELSWQ